MPALQKWLAAAQERQSQGLPVVGDTPAVMSPLGDVKKRKKRTVFTTATVGVLCEEYRRNSSPSSADIDR